MFYANSSLSITETVDCKYSAFRRFWNDQDNIEYEDAFSQQVLVSVEVDTKINEWVKEEWVRMKSKEYAFG